MNLADQTYLVCQALTRLWNSDGRVEPAPDLLATINTAFWAQDNIGRALLRRYYESGFAISALVEAALEQSPEESPDGLICRVFESFLASMSKNEAPIGKRGRRRTRHAKRTYNKKPRPAPPEPPPMPPAPPTLAVKALCEVCGASIELPRGKEFDLRCHECGLKLRGVIKSGQAQLTVLEASIPGVPKTREECCKVLGIPISASPAAVKNAYRRKVKLVHPDRFHGRADRLQKIAAKVTLALNLAFEMIRSCPLVKTA